MRRLPISVPVDNSRTWACGADCGFAGPNAAFWLLVAFFLALGSSPGARAQGERFVSGRVEEGIGAFRREKASWTPRQRKIDSNLLLHSKWLLNQPIAAGVPRLRTGVSVSAEGRTLVDITARISDGLLNRIQQLGGRVVNSVPRFNTIRAEVPVTQMDALASEAAVLFIRPADAFMLNKDNTSEGDVAHRTDDVRLTFGVDGTGVKVGVLSDSVDALAALQASGDLPATVTVLPGQSGGAGSSEGTALLEIAYDLAPGASLCFATASGGQAQFAQNILDLRAAGCDVIVDDVSYFAESVFQDGIIARSVEDVVAHGAVYYSSAGNSGNKNDDESGVWEGDFAPVSWSGQPLPLDGLTVHDFGGGVSYNRITVDSPYAFTLQWSDAWGASANDYDLYLLDPTGTEIVASSINAQDGSGGNDFPFEGFGSDPHDSTDCLLVVVLSHGAPRFLHLNSHRGRLAVSTAGQISGHGAAAAAFSVAAVRVPTDGGEFTGGSANPAEFFSSDGPRRVFYYEDGTPITPGDFSSTGGVVRQKPDVAAADGVSCATPGFETFYGTSAAAPHAAAIAALMIESGLTTTAEIRSRMTGTTWDIEATGVDRDSGYGIVNAYNALNVLSLIVGRSVFYNQSAWDGGRAAADAGDDNAIATDKQPLVAGVKATFANYTSFNRGINGIMIDIVGMPGVPTVDDFAFKVGNSDSVAGWAAGPTPTAVALRRCAGAEGSDRITLIWGADAAKKRWLQIRMLANGNTGLGADDVFYFGNAVGECGNSTTDAQVNATDEIRARANPRGVANPAPVTFFVDYNRDTMVNATDQILARANVTGVATALKLITPTGAGALLALAGETGANESDAGGWLDETPLADATDASDGE